jgi:CO/xanthine dehydrogenase FAD-binding subunit
VIVEYHRPTTLEEALDLLSRSEPHTLPLGGGTALNTRASSPPGNYAVVDLQALGLDQIQRSNAVIQVGAMVRLQRLLDEPGFSDGLYRALAHEAARNIRQAATVAGSLVSAGGRSAYATALLAMDAVLVINRKTDGGYSEAKLGLGDWLPFHRQPFSGAIITQVLLPAKLKLAYHYVARTSADLPIVCAAAARWPSGRTRVALGGTGDSPVLVMDGPEPEGAEIAARAAYDHAGDEWASAEYRSEMAGILVQRCLVE